MSREILTHFIDPGSPQILVLDEPGPGGANHHYKVVMPKTEKYPQGFFEVFFQKGGVLEAGVNGTHNEVLLAIVQDRLEGFQGGKFACLTNAIALRAVRVALGALKYRTIKRKAQSVEGVSNAHTEDEAELNALIDEINGRDEATKQILVRHQIAQAARSQAAVENPPALPVENPGAAPAGEPGAAPAGEPGVGGLVDIPDSAPAPDDAELEKAEAAGAADLSAEEIEQAEAEGAADAKEVLANEKGQDPALVPSKDKIEESQPNAGPDKNPPAATDKVVGDVK